MRVHICWADSIFFFIPKVDGCDSSLCNIIEFFSFLYFVLTFKYYCFIWVSWTNWIRSGRLRWWGPCWRLVKWTNLSLMTLQINNRSAGICLILFLSLRGRICHSDFVFFPSPCIHIFCFFILFWCTSQTWFFTPISQDSPTHYASIAHQSALKPLDQKIHPAA